MSGDERDAGAPGDEEVGRAASARPLLRVVGAALMDRVNVALGGLALAAAAALGSWRLAAIAAGAYLALVAFDCASPSFRRAQRERPP